MLLYTEGEANSPKEDFVNLLIFFFNDVEFPSMRNFTFFLDENYIKEIVYKGIRLT